MIRTAEQYNETYSRLIALDILDRELTTDEQIEYDILAHLIDEYNEQQLRGIFQTS